MPMPVPVRPFVHALLAAVTAMVTLLFVTAPAEARTLNQGQRGADVRALQKLLRQAGFPAKVDGVFGRGTYRTLRRLERELGLTVDGRLTGAEMRRVRTALKPAEGSGGFSADAMNRPRAVSSQQAAGAKAQLTEDGLAIPPADAPHEVKKVIAAANEIAKTPYKWGGGHGSWQDTRLRLLGLGLLRPARRRPARRARCPPAASRAGARPARASGSRSTPTAATST